MKVQQNLDNVLQSSGQVVNSQRELGTICVGEPDIGPRYGDIHISDGSCCGHYGP